MKVCPPCHDGGVLAIWSFACLSPYLLHLVASSLHLPLMPMQRSPRPLDTSTRHSHDATTITPTNSHFIIAFIMPAAKSAATKTSAAVRSNKRKEAPASTGAAAKKSKEPTAKPTTKKTLVPKAADVVSTRKKGTSGKTGVGKKTVATPSTAAKKSKVVAKGKAAPAVKKTARSSTSSYSSSSVASSKQVRKMTMITKKAPVATANVAAHGKGSKEVEAMDRKSLQVRMTEGYRAGTT